MGDNGDGRGYDRGYDRGYPDDEDEDMKRSEQKPVKSQYSQSAKGPPLERGGGYMSGKQKQNTRKSVSFKEEMKEDTGDGRPLISAGDLPPAKQRKTKTMSKLGKFMSKRKMKQANQFEVSETESSPEYDERNLF